MDSVILNSLLSVQDAMGQGVIAVILAILPIAFTVLVSLAALNRAIRIFYGFIGVSRIKQSGDFTDTITPYDSIAAPYKNLGSPVSQMGMGSSIPLGEQAVTMTQLQQNAYVKDGQPLLAPFENAIRARDKASAQNILNQMSLNPVYAGYMRPNQDLVNRL